MEQRKSEVRRKLLTDSDSSSAAEPSQLHALSEQETRKRTRVLAESDEEHLEDTTARRTKHSAAHVCQDPQARDDAEAVHRSQPVPGSAAQEDRAATNRTSVALSSVSTAERSNEAPGVSAPARSSLTGSVPQSAPLHDALQASVGGEAKQAPEGLPIHSENAACPRDKCEQTEERTTDVPGPVPSQIVRPMSLRDRMKMLKSQV